jgi:hypothetical protein
LRTTKGGRIGLGLTVLFLSLATPARAGLVTFQFSGVIENSTSKLVNVGDSFSGTFTYDTDAPNQALSPPSPIPPVIGIYDFNLPQSSSVGMTHNVGPLSYSTHSLLAVTVTNDSPLLGDSLDVASDGQIGPFVPARVSGGVFLADLTGSALSSIQPPSTLDLAAFGDFHDLSGTDGTLVGRLMAQS